MKQKEKEEKNPQESGIKWKEVYIKGRGLNDGLNPSPKTHSVVVVEQSNEQSCGTTSTTLCRLLSLSLSRRGRRRRRQVLLAKKERIHTHTHRVIYLLETLHFFCVCVQI